MKTIGIGFTLLLMQFLPTAWLTKLISGGMYGSIFKGVSPIWYHLFSLTVSVLMAGIIVWVFLRKSQLESRLPEIIPGKNWLIAGIAILVLYTLPRLFASTIQGGGPSFVVMQFSPLFIYPARIFLIIGFIQVLLAASPITSNNKAQSTANASAG